VEAVEFRRALARQNPDGFNPDLAISLGRLGATLAGNGRRAATLVNFAEGLRLL